MATFKRDKIGNMTPHEFQAITEGNTAAHDGDILYLPTPNFSGQEKVRRNDVPRTI